MHGRSRIITLVSWWGAAALVGVWAGVAFCEFLWARNAAIWAAMMFGPLAVLVVAILARAVMLRRRGAQGCCVTCNYDRTGIGPGRACPECGTVPGPSERAGR